VDIPRFPADAGGEEVAAGIDAAGCAVVEGLATPALLDAFRVEVEPYLAATPNGRDGFAGFSTRRTGGLVGRVPSSRPLIMDPLVLDVVGRVLWSDKTTFQLHLTQLIAIGPGQGAQYVHRDAWAFDQFPFPAGIELQCNTMWALTDFTEANGATRVVPGSHTADEGLRFEQADTVPAEMAAGSVLFYTGRLYHGGGANTSDDVRIGINLDYTVGWLRQEENQYLAVPPEVARTLPDDLLRLMGYSLGAFALGYVDDLRDPLDVLRGTGSERASFTP